MLGPMSRDVTEIEGLEGGTVTVRWRGLERALAQRAGRRGRGCRKRGAGWPALLRGCMLRPACVRRFSSSPGLQGLQACARSCCAGAAAAACGRAPGRQPAKSLRVPHSSWTLLLPAQVETDEGGEVRITVEIEEVLQDDPRWA